MNKHLFRWLIFNCKTDLVFYTLKSIISIQCHVITRPKPLMSIICYVAGYVWQRSLHKPLLVTIATMTTTKHRPTENMKHDTSRKHDARWRYCYCWKCDIYTTKPLLLIRDLYVMFRLKKNFNCALVKTLLCKLDILWKATTKELYLYATIPSFRCIYSSLHYFCVPGNFIQEQNMRGH